MKKRLTAILLALCMCTNLVPNVFEPQEVYAAEESESCGESASYKIYTIDDNTFASVYGTGEAELRISTTGIDVLIVEAGITKISSVYTFYGTDLVLNEGLEVIGSGVVGPYIKELTIPSTVTTFEVNSLIRHQLEEIEFLGARPKITKDCFSVDSLENPITAYYPSGKWTQEDFQYLNGVTTWIPFSWDADGSRIPDESQKYTVSAWIPQLEDSGTCGTNATYTMYDDGSLYIKGTGYIEGNTFDSHGAKIEIGEGITGISDGSRDDGIFYDPSPFGTRESILLPSTLEYIGNYAFYFCRILKEIGITKNVKTVGEEAFSDCKLLEEINLESAKTIGSSAFAYCESLQSVTLAGGVEIGTHAFCYCPSLSEIIYTGAPPVFERKTFATYSATDDMSDYSDITVYYPDNAGWTAADMQHLDRETTYYVPYTLDANGNMIPHTDRTTVVKFQPQSSGTFDAGGEWYIEDDILHIYGAYDVSPAEEIAYYDHWKNIKGLVVEEGVNYFGFSFNDYENLKTVTFPTSYSGGCSFNDCDSLERIDLPNKVPDEWNDRNFCPTLKACNSLKSLTIPVSVKEMSNSIIKYCDNLEEITFLGDAPEFSEYAIRKVGEIKFYYPANNATWTEAIRSKGYGSTVTWIPYTLDAQGNRIADMSKAVTTQRSKVEEDSPLYGWLFTLYSDGTMTINVDVTKDSSGYLSRNNIYWCFDVSRVTRVEIGEGVKEIATEAFAADGTEHIESIILPSTLSIIGNSAFRGMKSLKVIDMSKVKQLSEMGESCFANAALETITLPKGLTKIPKFAFASSSLKSIVIPDSVTEIGEDAFSECAKLETVQFGKGVNLIGVRAFFMAGMKSIDIPGNVKEICYSAFEGCKNLESVTLHEGLERIGDAAFLGTAIKEVILPESVTDLSYSNSGHVYSEGVYGTFSGCENLVRVKLPSNIDKIPEYCFNDCKNLREIELPKNLTYIANGAFASTGIEEITIPSPVIHMEAASFADCSRLKKVIFTGQVTSVEWGAFTGTDSVTAYVPKELKDFYGESYFYWNPEIKTCHPYTINANGTYVVEETITEAQVKERIQTAKNLYPEGYSLDQYSMSVLNGVVGGKVYPIGFGSKAFAYILSDHIFEDRTVEFDREVSFEEVRVGDILGIDNGSRAVVVTEKRANDVVVAQGDWKGTVHWGEVLDKATVDKASFRITRYRMTTFSMASELNTIVGGNWENHFPTLPTTMPTEEEAYKRMMQMQKSLPEGFPFSEEILYDINAETSGATLFGGQGSSSFAYMLSDLAFGKAAVREHNGVEMDAIMVGDMLLSTDYETDTQRFLIVLEVYKDCIVVAEGDYNGTVHWGRTISKEEVEGMLSHYTRYPEGTTHAERTDSSKFNITLDKTKATLKNGESLTLKATVTAPADATSKAVKWSTSDWCVTVDENGKVTAIADSGTAVITASVHGKEATCTITVKAGEVTAVKLNKTKLNLVAGKTYTLKPTITPSNATNQKITWSSSDKKIATVDKNGKVKGIKAGTVTITAKTANGKKATCKVTVVKATLNATSFPLQVKKTATLKVTSNLSGDKVKSWKSSNKKIATVSSKGVVKGIKNGKATITVTMKSGATAKCTVTVQKDKVTTKKLVIDQKKLTLQKGKTTTLKVTRNPISATEKITWKSSNKKVATVDKNGKVKGIKAGTATITATSSNGKKVTCKVTVKNPSVKLEKTKATIKVGKTTTIKIKSKFPTNDKVKSYTSSNKKIAMVDKNGKVKGIKAGKATITVKMKSGAKVKFTVTVKKK